jgi:uncharacterized protein YdeI (YjbR/CyaY-like superfamily)
MNPIVDKYISHAQKWQEEFKQLRRIILSCGLHEDFKWGNPCYTLNGKNVVLIHGFKEYCAIMFFKGALLKDELGILFQQTENVQAVRQVRFTNVGEIIDLEPTLKAYIYEAVELEKAGLKVKFKKVSEYPIPEELQNKFDENPALEKAFKALTPGRQRAYIFYISQAKQSKTRVARVEKSIPSILMGKGLDD